MGQEAGITDAEIRKLCDGIITAQREGIAQMEPIIERPTLKRARVRAARDRHGPAVACGRTRMDSAAAAARRKAGQLSIRSHREWGLGRMAWSCAAGDAEVDEGSALASRASA